jgi:hypothetical protein
MSSRDRPAHARADSVGLWHELDAVPAKSVNDLLPKHQFHMTVPLPGSHVVKEFSKQDGASRRNSVCLLVQDSAGHRRVPLEFRNEISAEHEREPWHVVTYPRDGSDRECATIKVPCGCTALIRT